MIPEAGVREPNVDRYFPSRRLVVSSFRTIGSQLGDCTGITISILNKAMQYAIRPCAFKVTLNGLIHIHGKICVLI